MEQPDRRGSSPANLSGSSEPGGRLRIRQCIEDRSPVRGYFLWADGNAHAARNAGRGLSRHHRAAAQVYPDSFRALAGGVAGDPGLQSISLRSPRIVDCGARLLADSVAEAEGL